MSTTISPSDLPEDLAIPEARDLVIDPKSALYQQLAPMCDPTNPSSCLVAVLGSVTLGHRTSFTFEHTPNGPVNHRLRISLGRGYAAVKNNVSPALVRVADKFDKGQQPKQKVTEHVDLFDGSWTFTYQKPGKGKTAGSNKNKGAAKQTVRSVRARSLARVQKAFSN